MPIARFSPFELLLLKSRNQADTAGLLLLAWVLASKGHLSEGDRQRLSELSREFRHGHELEPIVDIAIQQDLGAIQLAAEVMQKDCCGEQAYPFLRQVIALAITEGKLAIANHHILRFLADLLGVSPPEFAHLFTEVAGKEFANPDDPSRTGYWQAKERHRQQQEERQRQHQQSHERHSSGHQYRQHSGTGGSQRQHHYHSTREPPPGEQTRRALAVLGLEPGASRHDIRKAYRRLAQLHHPDRFFAEGDAVVATASRRFQRIRKAYDYLMQAG
ncbi:J domain-containing protein [Litchfieldella rifensis]|uniref:J domain-containing protein n=1 Tax=Litchfieldella rifensis TaxID=762643 RepID=A0ABV7LIV0_9GAMM